MNNLNGLAQTIFNANREKGFWDKERNIGELLMLVTSELGEAMEAHRKDRFADRPRFNGSKVAYSEVAAKDFAHKKAFESHIKDTFEDEIADAMIRLFDMCGGLGIDIEYHIEQKLAYNKTRERLHGKSY